MCAMCLCQQHASLWPPDERPTAAAVCMAESGGNPGARNHRPGIEDSRGLWQVNWLAHPRYDGEALYDPGYNAQAALDIWRGSGWLLTGYVSAANTVTVRLTNNSGGVITPLSGALRADVWRH